MQSNSFFRSLKATLYSYYIDFKDTFLITFIILLGIMLLPLAFALIPIVGSSHSNSSALNTGFNAALWVIPIFIIIVISNTVLLKKFSFPVDRMTLAISHVIFILAAPLVMLLTSCALYLFEYGFYSLIQPLVPGLAYVWLITKESFLTGFILSYCILVLISSIVYFIFMYFYRYKAATSVAAGGLMLLLISSRQVSGTMKDFFGTMNLWDRSWTYSFIFLGISLVLWVLAFIPLKRMEVRK